MEQSIRLLSILRYAFLGSIFLYIAVGETLNRVTTPNLILFYALTFAAITAVGAILVIRRTMVVPSETALRIRTDDAVSVNRWRTGCIVTYAMSEAVALFGLVLRITGFTLSQVAAFYIAGIVLLLFFSPQPRISEADSLKQNT
jgi:hypothetical protein